MDEIKLLIVDDHVLVREGLRNLIDAQPDLKVVGEASDGIEAAEKASATKPDVILMDITMPGMSGLESTKLIRKNLPDAKVLVLTMHEDEAYFFKLLSAGASGYFVKGGATAELLSAIRAVYRGDVYFYPSMAKSLLKDYLKRSEDDEQRQKIKELTTREQEILGLIAQGLHHHEIAEKLSLSPTTIQTHRARIISKLGLHNRTELVKYAVKHGIITLDE